jgi:hypothetical protein
VEVNTGVTDTREFAASGLKTLASRGQT